MNNPIMPVPCEILSVKQESRHEYTYRVKTDIRPSMASFCSFPSRKSARRRFPSADRVMAG